MHYFEYLLQASGKNAPDLHVMTMHIVTNNLYHPAFHIPPWLSVKKLKDFFFIN